MSRSVAVFLASGGVIIILRDVAKGAAHVSSDFGLLPSDGRVGVAGDANLRSKPAEPFDVIRAVREFVVLEERALGFLQPPQSRAHELGRWPPLRPLLAGTARYFGSGTSSRPSTRLRARLVTPRTGSWRAIFELRGARASTASRRDRAPAQLLIRHSAPPLSILAEPRAAPVSSVTPYSRSRAARRRSRRRLPP